jgi:integrase
LARPDCELDSEPPVISVSKSLEQTKAGLRIKTTKNRRARRFKLPKRAVEILRAHFAKQDDARKLFGPDYRCDLDLVFAAPDGAYLRPDSVTAKVSLLARKCKLAGISLHSMRHMHGTQLLAAGVPLPVVSKRLGHSSVKVTAEVYAHALEKDELAAADAWDKLMERPQTEPQSECWQSVGKSPLPN